MLEKIKSIFKNDKVTIDELYNELRSYNKNILVKELIVQAQEINSNQCGVPGDMKKMYKNYSKKQLIKAIILLRIQNNNKVKKVIKKMEIDANARQSGS